MFSGWSDIQLTSWQSSSSSHWSSHALFTNTGCCFAQKAFGSLPLLSQFGESRVASFRKPFVCYRYSILLPAVSKPPQWHHVYLAGRPSRAWGWELEATKWNTHLAADHIYDMFPYMSHCIYRYYLFYNSYWMWMKIKLLVKYSRYVKWGEHLTRVWHTSMSPKDPSKDNPSWFWF